MNKIFEINIQDSNHLKKYITSVCPMELTNTLGDKRSDVEVFNQLGLPSQLNSDQVDTILFLMKESKSVVISPDVEKIKEKMTLWSLSATQQTFSQNKQPLDNIKEKEITEIQIEINNKLDELKKRHRDKINMHSIILFKIDVFDNENNKEKSLKIERRLSNLSDLSWHYSNKFFENMHQAFRSGLDDDYKYERFIDCKYFMKKLNNSLNEQDVLFRKLENKLNEKFKNVSCAESKNLIEHTDKLLKNIYILFDRKFKFYTMTHDSRDAKIIEDFQKFKNSYNKFGEGNDDILSELSSSYKHLYFETDFNDQRKSFLSDYGAKLKKLETTTNEIGKLADEYEEKLNMALKNKQNKEEKGHGMEQ